MNNSEAQTIINRLHECADAILDAIRNGDLPNFDPSQPIHPDVFGVSDGEVRNQWDANEIAWAQAYLKRLGMV